MHIETLQLFPDRPKVTLTALLWDPTQDCGGTRPRPAVIVAPGGAYMTCADRECDPIALHFSAMGYQTFVLRYSVYGNKGGPRGPMGPGGPGGPGAPALEPYDLSVFPGPELEMAKAMLTIRDHAQEWCVDAGRIAICGFSAGGHLCAQYSVMWNNGLFAQTYGRPAEDFRPNACILGYAVLDHRIVGRMGDFSDNVLRMQLLSHLGSMDPSEEMREAATPICHVSKDTPPTFLWSCRDDGLVPPVHTLGYATALAKAGVPFELHMFESGGHGVSTATDSCASFKGQTDEIVSSWMSICETWLHRRFAHTLAERPPMRRPAPAEK